jgi:hypothetical protein
MKNFFKRIWWITRDILLIIIHIIIPVIIFISPLILTINLEKSEYLILFLFSWAAGWGYIKIINRIL